MSHEAGAALVFGVGASAGVGGAVCRRALREGMRVFAAGRTQARLDQLASELSSPGAKLTPIACDVTREADVARGILPKPATRYYHYVDTETHNGFDSY